ncbi:cell surface receptor IPT/TIG and fibronectin domain-containing protein [Gottschalkia acidurici 9a]|uniref:Cell surface receptor IPT/TIG and fibronectin domain-containing protein n=1 Tax=Gottschalkia acidurici (strain ATCC 7906 / DSM 604 / BCRC 14475 / CIP 104303 / KCTC 5404 / NCIMB 10678 / 9a) TaxID=1128398 RepID=K0AXV8_GOTA9|nr:IPT/TIG domain-containing protein [Gottschalkia acidurici]AFS77246.1 cell surface receptor IPT/TIG and fibronectin domain-containing protein [Gottschalkia acidurici 9a]
MKRIISMFLAIIMLLTYIPFGDIAIASADGKIDITNMQINTEIRRQNSNGQTSLRKTDFVDIEGFGFRDVTIKNVKIKQYSSDKPPIPQKELTSTFNVVGGGKIRVTLDGDSPIESNLNYKVEITYEYKEDNVTKTEIEESKFFSVDRKPDITHEPNKTVLNIGDEISIVGTGLKDAKLKFKKGNTISEAMYTTSSDNNITGKVDKDKNVTTGLNDIVIESAQVSESGLPVAKVTFIEAVEINLESTIIDVSNITPTAGPTTGGTEVRITGKGLTDTATVRFGDNLARIIKLEDIVGNSEEKRLVVSAPKSDITGPVTITINGKGVGTFTYIATGNSLLVTGIAPDRGNVLGGDIVEIRGFNFQLTKGDGEEEGRKFISDEGTGDVEISDGDEVLMFKKDVSKEKIGFKRPTEEAKYRTRAVKVTVGGESATYKLEEPIKSLEDLTRMDPKTGEQMLKIVTPSMAVQEDTVVSLAVEVITKFYKDKPENSDNELKDLEIVEREFREFIYETVKIPKVEKVTPTLGSTSDVDDVKTPEVEVNRDEGVNFPTVSIKGEKFLVESKVGADGVRKVERPKVFVVPSDVSDSVIKSNVGVDKYRAKVREVSLDSSGETVEADGVFNKLATKIVAELPAYPHEKEGPKDIVIVNPDGGYLRMKDAFIYKKPSTEPEIIEIKPMKVNAKGGEKITIEGKNIDPLVSDIIVTIDGEVSKIEKIDRVITNEENRQIITVVTPPGKAGLKIVQVINRDGGTATSDISNTETPEGKLNRKLYYTRVTSAPKITVIAPNYGGAGAKVIIKGSDFVIPEKDEDDNPIPNSGTRVWFGNHEIKNGESYGKDRFGEETEGKIEIIDTKTIELTLPSGLPLGFKDVIVENPDTARDAVKNGFNYLEPQTNPQIYSIEPNYGTINGGTMVKIKGEGFTDNVEVYFGEKKGIKPIVNGDGTEIIVETPSYPIDSTNMDNIKVHLTVVNYDGGANTIDNGFEYRIPGSFPFINKIDPASGTMAGNDTVVITGGDFRYKKAEGNEKKDRYEEGDEIPRVYFGGEEAINVRYAGNSQLIVTTPSYNQSGRVDVVIVNPDAGTAISKGGFTYGTSKPTITSITPSVIDKNGGTVITIKGSGFIKGEYENKIDIDTLDLQTILGNEKGTRQIIGGFAELKVGTIDVVYDARDSQNPTIKVKSDFEEKEFTERISRNNPLLVAMKTTKDSEYLEGIKVSIEGNNLTVTRRLATKVEWIDGNTLEITTPPMDGVGERDIVITNKDGGEAKGKVTVKNPASNPKITNIEPKIENYDASNALDFYSVESTAEGNITFTIYGSDFRTGVKVLIGDQEAQILSKGPNDDNLIVRSPRARTTDIDKKLIITILNEDGGVVASNDAEKVKIGAQGKQAYYIYRNADSSPKVTKIDPNIGSIKGGERVVITGNDFRPEQVEVKFGGRLATVVQSESRYDRLVVITPQGDMVGKVDVHIKNTKALGEIVVKDGYTYISSPIITSIDPDRVKNDGEHKVTIKGSGFMEGIKVTIGDLGDVAISELEFKDSQTIEMTISPKVEINSREESVFRDVTIENPDGGKYTSRNGLEITHPIPDTPSGFRATAGHERSITLTWDKVEDAGRYKIFASKSGRRSDYEFLGETTDLEYIVKDLEPDTRYYFRLWSLNKYGESISYDYDDARTFRNKDDDGRNKYDNDTESRKDTVINYTNGELSINLADRYNYGQYYQDLSDAKYSNYKNMRISIPINVAKSLYGNVQVKTQDILFDIPLGIFSDIAYYKQNDDANVIVTLSKLDSQEKGRITKGIERNEAVLEDGYEIKFEVQNEREVTPIAVRGSASLTVYTDKAIPNTNSVYMGRYSPESNNLLRNTATVSQYVDYMTNKRIYAIYGNINAAGKYTIIYKK